LKISATITSDEFHKIERHIACREWGNPIEDEFVFYDPTGEFLTLLTLFDITYYKED